MADNHDRPAEALGADQASTPQSDEDSTLDGVSARIGNSWYKRRKIIGFATAAGLCVIAIGFLVGTIGGSSEDRPSDRATPPSATVDLLKSMLPQGRVSGVSARGVSNAPGASPFVQLAFDDGQGKAKIALSFVRIAGMDSSPLTRCPLTSQSPTSTCTRSSLPDGSILVVNKQYENGVKKEGVQRWTAISTSNDGKQTVVSSWNAASEKAATAGRPTPPLTTDQLAAIASSPRWNSVLTAMPPPSEAPPLTQGTASEEQILKTVKALLPARLRVADEEGQPGGYADLTVDDGAGKTLVSINVQQWKPSDSRINQLYRDAIFQTDGTRLVTQQAPSRRGGQGATEWVADTLRAKYMRVVISELNAPSYGINAVREKPALTMEELTALALSPAWEKIS